MSYWWVFQGKYFSRDNTGGFIEARKQGNNGNARFDLANVGKVKKGDYIIAYKKGYIVSIGEVRKNPVTVPSSIDNTPAWQAKVDWTNLNPPFPVNNTVWNNTKNLFNGKKYMPLDCNGDGNNGYLFQIDNAIFTAYLDYIRKFVIQI